MAFKCQRWTLANILPVGFMLVTVAAIWILYVWLHLLPLMFGEVGHAPCRANLSSEHQVIAVPDTQMEPECISAAFRRGTVQTFLQQFLTIMLLICFGRAAASDPGSVPDDKEWMPQRASPPKKGPEEEGVDSENDATGIVKKVERKILEVKHSGARRFCKWCNRFKPDRSHHCRVCRSCILRMDHHCPWIANCVGFGNHKYFFLLVFYALLDSGFVIVTLSETLYRSLGQDTLFLHRFLIVFCMTLSVMMGVLLALFFAFHTWLMLRALSTIEFCEKTYRQLESGSAKGSIYDLGCMANVRAVLGENMLLWFLPVGLPRGDGLSYRAREAYEKEDEDSETTALLPKSQMSKGPISANGSNKDSESWVDESQPDPVPADAEPATPEVTPCTA